MGVMVNLGICIGSVLVFGGLGSGVRGPLPGIDTGSLDRTVVPADDFYRFANGLWLDKATIPEDQPSQGAFSEVNTLSENTVHRILDRLAADGTLKPGTDERKVADFYRVALDDPLADRVGIKPIELLLKECDGVTDAASTILTAGRLSNVGVSAFFGSGIEGDAQDSRRKMFTITQGGLGLPDRDYYLNDDPTFKFLRQLYLGHVARSLTLIGYSAAESEDAANRIVAIETRLARASRTQVAMRDVKALVNKTSVARLEDSSTVIPWKEYFRVIDMDKLVEVNVATPEFFKGLEALLTEIPVSDLKLYLKWHTLSAFSEALGKRFRDEDFKFSSVLTGQKSPVPAWKRALHECDVLGFAIGKIYVRETFPAASKAKAKRLILALRGAFRKRLVDNAWMSSKTKTEALRKLDRITIKVGYPDKWESYRDLEVGTDSLASNFIRAAKYAHSKSVREFFKPTDRSQWGMTPQTVNAYYNPQNNEIVFPAAILQPPFFDPKADDASNFGAIGMVMGHEMTHGFDDQGRTFDALGNLRDWWTSEDAAKFKALTDRIAEQYSRYTAVGDTEVNGQLTIGENVADLGGIHIAYDALEAQLKGKPRSPVGGFTPEQRFFIAFAQIWRFKTTKQFAELLAKIDVHSPNPVRVSGTLFNVPEFVGAFGKATKPSSAAPGAGSLRIW